MLTDNFRPLENRKIREKLLSDEFLDFVQKNRLPLQTLMTYYRCAIMEVETKFKVLDAEFSLEYDRNPIESIRSRIKSEESLLRKIRKKGIPLTLEAVEREISDIAGIRVVCSFLDDIYLLADCLLSQDDITLVEKKDYIQNPKESGYRSLHLIVSVPIFLQNQKRSMKVEVQLRTIAMDFWASLEHKLQYKKNIPEQEAISISEELTQCATRIAELDQEMQKIHARILQEEQNQSFSNEDSKTERFGFPLLVHGKKEQVRELFHLPQQEELKKDENN